MGRLEIEAMATDIVDAALKVHKALGPGLLESSFQQCLVHELRKRDHEVETEVVLPIRYDDIKRMTNRLGTEGHT